MTTTSKEGLLFGRSYTLQVVAPVAPGDFSLKNDAKQYGNVGKNAAALRIAFEISQNVKSSPNKGTFSVFNFAPATRQAITHGYQIIFSAGYGSSTDTLFSGLVHQAKVERSGPDIVTKIECDDGGSVIHCSNIDQAFPPGTLWVDVVQAVINKMGLPTPFNPLPASFGIVLGLPASAVFARGYSARGKCADVLKSLCRNHGLDWYIHNGALNIVPQYAHNGNSAVLMSSKTGMVGVPSRSSGGMTEFTSLINTKLVPGRLVLIDSENRSLNGLYKVLSVKTEGDTHDSKWYNLCECVPMSGGSTQKLKPASNGNAASGVG